MFTSAAFVLHLVGSVLLVAGALRMQIKSNVSPRWLLVMAVCAAILALGCAAFAVDQIRAIGRTPVDILAIVVAVNYSLASAILFRASRHATA
jgi:hypothetical protein